MFNFLSLRGRFLVAPFIGVFLTLILYFASNAIIRSHSEFFQQLHNSNLPQISEISRIAVLLINNHSELTALLLSVNKDTDEEQVYLQGRKVLDDLHSIEGQLYKNLNSSKNISHDPGNIFEQFKQAFIRYREASISAIEFSTVDARLAQKELIAANHELTQLNELFLVLSKQYVSNLTATSGVVEDSLYDHNTVTILAIVLVLMMILSALYFSKSMSKDIDQINQILNEKQKKLSGLYELSPLGIALIDMDGNYLEFNEAFRTICGYSAEELKNLDYWTLTPRKYKEQEVAQLKLLSTTGRCGPYEKNFQQKNGNLVPVRVNGMLVKDQNGQPRVWTIVENISDSKRAEQALLTAKEEAEKGNLAKSRFLSSMSHELRTPMNIILGFSQLMDLDDSLPVEHRNNVSEILAAGYHLLELINDVLDLSKIESGHIDLTLESVEVCAVVEECLNLVSPLAFNRNIQLAHAGMKGTTVLADRRRLKQVLLNLFSNAIKYNREGGSVRVDVRLQGTDRLRVLVTDTGQGIPVMRLAELFQPFNRLGAENSSIEGTGIGLTIARHIIEMMGGAVDVESEVGVGSTFWIELPLEPVPEPAHGELLYLTG